MFGTISTVEDSEKKVLFLGLSLEDETSIKNLQNSEKKVLNSQASTNVSVAKYLANDLFHYIESFVKPTKQNNQEVLILPTDILDKWLKKILHKTSTNPFFWKQ